MDMCLGVYRLVKSINDYVLATDIVLAIFKDRQHK